MARYRARRFGRLTRYVLAVSAAVAVAVPAAVVFADSAVSPQAGAAPHLDAIERTLRQVSPGLEGSVWERTSGNSLDAFGGDSAGWLLQTPGCWGDNTCADRSGTQRMLAKLTADISKATRTVDLSTLAPLPDGAFQDAIVAGLKAAAAKNKLKVRILVGAVPLGNLNVVPSSYRDELNRKLGSAAANVTLHIASMNTQKTAFSWNHSKILLVDGRSAIVGGTNFWSAEYIDTTHPVSDVSFALAGPAATSAGRYLDTLWAWTCQNSWNPVYVWFASSNRAGCPATMQRDANPPTAAPTGKLPVIAVGSLGVGIKSVDPASKYRPTLPTADARCPGGPRDNTNANRDFDTVNPEESALRALVESARSQIVLSQQDLNSTCPPMPRYDIRMYDILAAKLAAGVKVRIVLSDPANGGSFGSAGYSQIKSLTEITDILRDRLTVRTGNQQTARAAICGNLQLASFRSAPEARWADGKPYAKHHKVILVDRSTFYLGSRNVYPAWLQDFGYIVESPAAAAQLSTSLLDREWKYSQQTATVDHERGVCTA